MLRLLGQWIAGMCLFLIIAEIVFRILPVSTSTEVGYHIDDLILTYPPHHHFIAATGWNLENVQRHRSNNFGFLSKIEFKPDPTAVALIGDSFVEASMLSESERLSTRLSDGLKNRAVYAFGGPGSSLLDYAERIRLAHQRFGIREFIVVLELGDIKQSLCGSGNNHGPCLAPATLTLTTTHPAATSVAKRYLRHSALAQYVFSQLKLAPARLLPALVESSKPVLPITKLPAIHAYVSPGEVSAIVSDAVHRAFFARIAPFPIARLIFVLDSDRQALNSGATPSTDTRRRFKAAAQHRGAEVIDLAETFEAALAATGLRLEISPRDAHWNPAAVTLIAQQVLALFNATP